MTTPLTAPAIRFRFGLTPLEEMASRGAGHPVRHWFGLTDGWYCVDLDGHEVLRYSARTVAELRKEGDPPHPYVDYYVARLWEDLLAIVSDAMEPVPGDLAGIAADPSPDWEWVDTPEAEAAADWHGAGYLYTGYLRVAPDLRFCRTVAGEDDVVIATWEQRADPEGVIEFAVPRSGRVTMRTSEFLAAVTELDRALFAAMDQRVRELAEFEPDPAAPEAMEQLRREHGDRATWLRRARDREPGTDWEAVRSGVRALLTAQPGPDVSAPS
ncbi:DUF5984 family protein [Streptomyces sp. NPDC001493]